VGGRRFGCLSGYFGNVSGLTSPQCSGMCRAGYYCVSPSTSAMQHECGSPAVYCPAGSGEPRVASPGELTIGGTNSTRQSTEHCPSSLYCVNGTSSLCPAGRFGCATGLGTPGCNGPCAPGYYCPAGSGSNRQVACGNSSVYCPEGASWPLLVGRGNFSSGGSSAEHQAAQEVCPAGHYCERGNKVHCAAVCVSFPDVIAPYLHGTIDCLTFVHSTLLFVTSGMNCDRSRAQRVDSATARVCGNRRAAAFAQTAMSVRKAARWRRS
jgi:hypothetical protein